ncbi:Ig-like domain repeat protein [Leptolyngbya sp. FACHB-8]|nr:Ig-like domain repeat protein [Leptolyngbya sp. FACHB-8]
MRQIDLLGNTSAATSFTFTLDTIAPDTPTIGAIAGDNVISVLESTNGVVLTGSAESGATVNLNIGGFIRTVTAANGSWSYTLTNTEISGLGQGTRTVTATATDAAGNISTQLSQTFAIETLIPTTASLSLGLDSGNSSNDGITNSGLVNVSGLQAGSIREYSTDNGQTWITFTGTSFTLTDDGAKSVVVRQTDEAGNISISPALSFVLDTTAPTQTATVIRMTRDTGASATDFLTTDGAAGRTYTGVLSGALGTGETLQISVDGGTTWTNATVNGTNWTFNDTIAKNGNWSIQTRVVDTAGNTGTVTSQPVILDTLAPTQTAVVTSMTKDTGDSATDFITTDGTAGRTYTGTLSAALGNGETLQVSLDGGASWSSATVTGTTWTFDDTIAKNGNWNIQTRVVDTAGNTGTVTSQPVILTNAVVSQTATVTSMTRDTGVSATDFITSDGTAGRIYTGTLSAALGVNESLQVSVDGGATWANAAVTGTTWTFDDTIAKSGNWNIQTRVIDDAGNTGTVTSQAVILDNGLPTQTATVISMTRDTGVFANDFITNDGAAGRTYTGTLSAALGTGETLQISVDGGATWVNVAVNGTNWTFNDSTAKNDNWSIETRVVDVAGNVGAIASQPVILDMVAPTQTAVVTSMTKDTGDSATDFITEDGTAGRIYTGTLSAALDANETLQVSVNGGVTWSSATVSGTTWTFNDTIAKSGSWSIQTRIVDTAGNIGTVISQPVILNNAPLPQTATITSMTKDTGVSTTDFITSDGTAGRTYTGSLLATLGADQTLEISVDDGVTWSSATVNGTTWTFDDTTAKSGDWSIQTRIVDATGNSGTVTSQLVTLDTAAPTQTATVTSMTRDTGASATDFITEDGAAGRTYTGTLSAALGADETLQVSVNGGITWSSATVNGTAWTFNDTLAKNSNWSIQTRVIDTAGNTGTVNSRTVILDTVAPTQTAVVTSMTRDTGVSATDFITTDGAAGRTYTGTLSAALGNGETLQISVDGGTTWSSATVTGTTWTFNDTIAKNGNWNIQTRVIDTAGNTGTVTSRSVILSNTVLAQTATVTSMTRDTGVSATDFITSDGAAGRTYTGTLSAALGVGETLQVSVNGGTTWVNANATGTSWTFVDNAAKTGNWNIQTRVTNTAGNVGAITTRAVTLDVAAPNVPTINAVAGDGRVNATERAAGVTVSGTAEANSRLNVTWGNTTLTTTTGGNGAWSLIFNNNQIPADGNTTISVTAQDAAGNTSPAATRAVAIDTAIATPTITAIGGPDSIVGPTAGDGQVVGTAEANSTVSLFFGTTLLGTVVADASGNWSYALTAANITTLGQGNNKALTVTARDAAGNLSTPSTPFTFTVATLLPGAPTISSIGGTDSIVSGLAGDAVVAGTAVANATVTLFLGSAPLATTVANANGNWAYPLTAADLALIGQGGGKSLTASVRDLLGNTSPLSTAFPFAVDTIAPSVPTIGAIATDNIINLAEFTAGVVLTGSTEAVSSVTLNVAGQTRMATMNGTTWSYTLSNADILSLGQGPGRTVTVTSRDIAGNATSTTSPVFTIDTVPPTGVAIAPIATNNIIDATEATTGVVLSGTTEAGSTVSLSLGGQTRSATVNGTTWSYTLTAQDLSNLGEGGGKTVTVTATDAVGNTTTLSSAAFTIDTLRPGAPTIGAIATNNEINAAEAAAGVVLSGTLEAGALITLNIGGQTRTATVNGTTWSYTLSAQDLANLGEGANRVVTVTASDTAGNASSTTSQPFAIDTIAPTAPQLSAADLDENNAPNALVATLSATDSNPVTYTLVAGLGADDNAAFTLTGNQLRINDRANFETQANYSIRIRATDVAGNTIEVTQTITVNDRNEAPTAIALSGNTVAENVAGAIIGTLTVADPDTLAAFQNNTVTVSDNRFEVVNNAGVLQLQLQANQSLNYEAITNGQLNLTLTAQDANTPTLSYSTAVALTVTNVDELPTAIALSNTTIAQNQPGAIVGNLTITDPDVIAAFRNYNLTVSDSRFEIVEVNGVLQLKLKSTEAVVNQGRTQARVPLTVTLAAGNNPNATITQTFLVFAIGEIVDRTLRTTPVFDNILPAAGSDTVIATVPTIRQNDQLDGGLGSDRLLLSEGTRATSLQLTLNTPNDQLQGIPGLSVKNFERFGFSQYGGTLTLTGSLQGDLVNSGWGNDSLNGDGGNDSLQAGRGNDTAWGGVGLDLLRGEIGNDRLLGGDGDDSLYGCADNDTLFGGLGQDLVGGNNGNDLLDGGADNDTIYGGLGRDTLLGGLGNDRLEGNGSSDRLSGDAGNDTLLGGAGIDALLGGSGNDTLNGQAGDDRLDGGSGDDLLSGGTGRDVIATGTGRDRLVLQPHQGLDQVTDFADGLDRIVLGNFRFEDLTIRQQQGGVLISRGGDRLLLLDNLNTRQITRADFV